MNKKLKHEAEPWYTTLTSGTFMRDDGEFKSRIREVFRKNGPITRIIDLRNEANLSRIILCVNALAGVDGDVLKALQNRSPEAAESLVEHFKDQKRRIETDKPLVDTPKIKVTAKK